MAISDTQKVDFLWKKIAFAKAKTDTNANKKGPNEANPSPLLLRGDKVWRESSLINATIPAVSNSYVGVTTSGAPVELTADGSSTTNRTWKTGKTNWIPPQFGSTYIVNVYIHTSGDAANAASISNRVFVTGSGNNDEWFFDYESGVINFIGTNLPNGKSFTGKSVYIEGCRYTGPFGVGSSGGGSSLGDITAENTTLTTPTNDNLILDPQGTGIVVINSTSSFKLPVGTTAQRPTSPDEGEIRYNSTTDQVEVYKNGAWERVGDPDTATLVHDEFDGDGSTTDFTLSNSASTNTVMVSNNGVLQEPTNAYTVSGTTLSFTEAPESGDKISVRVFSNITNLDKIVDADGDTGIEVERTADVDTINVKVAGTDKMSVSSTLTTHSQVVRFASYTTTQRDALSAANGDIIYNSTTNKFQGYASATWVDLH